MDKAGKVIGLKIVCARIVDEKEYRVNLRAENQAMSEAKSMPQQWIGT